MLFFVFVEGTRLPGSNALRHLSSGLRHLLSCYLVELFAPDRGVSTWKVQAGRRFRARGRRSWRHFFGVTLFGFGARRHL